MMATWRWKVNAHTIPGSASSAADGFTRTQMIFRGASRAAIRRTTTARVAVSSLGTAMPHWPGFDGGGASGSTRAGRGTTAAAGRQTGAWTLSSPAFPIESDDHGARRGHRQARRAFSSGIARTVVPIPDGSPFLGEVELCAARSEREFRSRLHRLTHLVHRLTALGADWSPGWSVCGCGIHRRAMVQRSKSMNTIVSSTPSSVVMASLSPSPCASALAWTMNGPRSVSTIQIWPSGCSGSQIQ